MGVALGWLTLALAAVAAPAAPEAGRGGVPIKYTVRFVEADGLGWRDAAYTRLTPVTRQGAATVWTAPSDVAKRLHAQALKAPSARVTQAPTVIAWPGSPAHIAMRSNQQLVTRVAWDGDDRPVAAKPETVRAGSAATMAGRKLDQGILVQLVLKDTQIIAVHRVTLGGPKGPHSDPAAKKAAHHAEACDTASKCCEAGETPRPTKTITWSLEFNLGGYPGVTLPAGRYIKDDVKLIPTGSDSCGSCTATKADTAKIAATVPAPKTPDGVGVTPVYIVNPVRDHLLTANVADGVVVASAPASSCCTVTGACGSCPGEAASRTAVAVEVPEIGSQEIAGEWLIPNDGILLVSFGPHTVADKDGKAVIRERLAIIEAEESAEPAVLPSPSASASAAALPRPNSARWSEPALNVPAIPSGGAFLPAPMMPSALSGAVPPPGRVPPPLPEAAAMPPMPSRSFPQGIHADGKAADLPTLPAEEADDDGGEESSESAEPRPSPQMKSPRHPDRAGEAKARKRPATTDAATKTAQFTMPNFPVIPTLFQPAPAVGLQFLIPIKPVTFKLPFNRRLELEIYGRVVRSPEPARSSADLVAKPAGCETTTK
jgi:hypothetical protein